MNFHYFKQFVNFQSCARLAGALGIATIFSLHEYKMKKGCFTLFIISKFSKQLAVQLHRKDKQTLKFIKVNQKANFSNNYI